jgi:hypothetical protein
MPKADTTRIVEADLLEHPAVRAWCELQPLCVEPERIEILKGKPRKQIERTKRFVCRLVGVGPAGSAVIGKRCWYSKAMIENTIYTDILPHLPVSSPGYYGMLEGANGEFGWLFLEDAGEQKSNKRNGEHRELAARWLGLMHTSAIDVDALACLPDKGPNHYLKRLQTGRDGILENLANLALEAHQLVPLETTLRQLDLLESHWDEVEGFCAGIPRTLVHGDFVAKNLRVRISQTGTALLPFDWGEAGWGTPVVDLLQVDVPRYWSMVRDHWPWLGADAVQHWASVGRIFRCLDAIYWVLPSFKHDGLMKPRSNMSIYASWLAVSMQAAGFKE